MRWPFCRVTPHRTQRASDAVTCPSSQLHSPRTGPRGRGTPPDGRGCVGGGGGGAGGAMPPGQAVVVSTPSACPGSRLLHPAALAGSSGAPGGPTATPSSASPSPSPLPAPAGPSSSPKISASSIAAACSGVTSCPGATSVASAAGSSMLRRALACCAKSLAAVLADPLPAGSAPRSGSGPAAHAPPGVHVAHQAAPHRPHCCALMPRDSMQAQCAHLSGAPCTSALAGRHRPSAGGPGWLASPTRTPRKPQGVARSCPAARPPHPLLLLPAAAFWSMSSGPPPRLLWR